MQPPDNYSIFDLMGDIDRMNAREEAIRRIAEMPDAEKFFMLGLLKHEEAKDGQAGIERVIKWIATRQA